jgi:hypothetical protein
LSKSNRTPETFGEHVGQLPLTHTFFNLIAAFHGVGLSFLAGLDVLANRIGLLLKHRSLLALMVAIRFG